jgi:hypothetical protein
LGGKGKIHMSQETPRHDITKKRVVYQIPGVDAVAIRRDVEYQVTDAGVLTMDIYYPMDSKSGARIPAVVFVIGYSDLGAQAILGCKFKEMESFISWAKLAAASGLVAITYTTGKEPAADVHALLQYVRRNAAELQIDENRIGLWACSGHVPNALSVLMQEGSDYLKCAVLCYGNMLDLDGYTDVAEAARTFRFVNPCAGKSVDDLPQDTPLFIVRAGQDHFPHLNEAIDRFLVKALIRNLPITFTNHPDGPHAFDILHDSEISREIIRQILAFMRFHLLA